MITCMYPLPIRSNCLGNSVYGYPDDIYIVNWLRTAIYRRIAVLPIYFYKTISMWGNNRCEHIFASDTIIDPVSLIPNDAPLVPVSVKVIRPPFYESDINHQNPIQSVTKKTTQVYLFPKNLEFLLSTYEPEMGMKNSDLLKNFHSSTVQNNGRFTRIIGFDEFCRIELNNIYNNVLFENKNLLNPLSRAQLVLANFGNISAVCECITDSSYVNQDTRHPSRMSGIIGIEQLLEDLDSTPEDWITDQLGNVVVDLVTIQCLRSPNWITLSDLYPLFDNDHIYRKGIYDLAIGQANATMNFQGTWMGFGVSSEHRQTGLSNPMIDIIDSINMCDYSDIVVECVDHRINYNFNDMIDVLNLKEEQLFLDQIGHRLSEMFISLQDYPEFPKGHCVTLTKNFMDEIFIVLETPSGLLTYYTLLPYLYMASPAIVTV